MRFHLQTFLFELFNFVVLAAILARLLWRPLRDVMAARAKEIADRIAEAERRERDAGLERDRLSLERAGIETERKATLDAARSEATEERRRITAEGKRELEAEAARVKAALQRERRDAMESLGDDVIAAASGLVVAALGAIDGDSLTDRLAGRLARELEALPPEERERLGRGAAGRLRLRHRGALGPAARRRVEEALAKFGIPAARLVVEPETGLEEGHEDPARTGVVLEIGSTELEATLGGLVASLREGAGAARAAPPGPDGAPAIGAGAALAAAAGTGS